MAGAVKSHTKIAVPMYTHFFFLINICNTYSVFCPCSKFKSNESKNELIKHWLGLFYLLFHLHYLVLKFSPSLYTLNQMEIFGQNEYMQSKCLKLNHLYAV